MSDAGLEPDEVLADRGLTGVVIGIVAPAAVAAIAYILWRTSDAMIQIGPLDRAQFGWGVAVPIWLATAVAAAFLWSRLTASHAVIAAAGLELVIGSVASWLMWRSLVDIECQFGQTDTPAERAFPAVMIGFLIALGPCLGGFIGRRYARRGSLWRMTAASAGVAFAMIWITILVGASMVETGACSRPPIG